ncbi:phosphatase PAP2 family protein [Vibrio fluvialis]|uniref:phosphatase PAP2 family protein n=1 Tax=Vibrio fluvialis TaxID=676 RepID=UPI002ACA2D16|nr:phosphatase PAP2 family protein [Vibrio fluvialis]MDZ5516203.1 phosphatase PAP2 family protein [Vibrio fluvialis]
MLLKQRLHDQKSGLTLLVLFVLILAPISAACMRLDFLQPTNEKLAQALSLLTNSAGKEGVVFTLILLLLWTGWGVRASKTEWLNKAIQLGVLLVLAMGLKTGIKALTESPRPYTEAMTQALVLPSAEHFYKLDTEQKLAVMNEIAARVSPTRLVNWKKEMDYSFPSGHTVFATLCLVFFGGILLEQQRRISAAVLLMWSCSIGFSRLWLGMHRPADLLGAALLVGLLYILVPRRYAFSTKLLSRVQSR